MKFPITHPLTRLLIPNQQRRCYEICRRASAPRFLSPTCVTPSFPTKLLEGEELGLFINDLNPNHFQYGSLLFRRRLQQHRFSIDRHRHVISFEF
jgi:hypothetical protein